MEEEVKNSLQVIQEEVNNPLQVIQEVPTPSAPRDSNEMKSDLIAQLKNEEDKKVKFEVPDSYLLAQEMKALFEEDVVTHVQGPSEPEGD
jgi:hypothetical protein